MDHSIAFSVFFYGTLQAQPPDELRFRQAQSMEGNRILAYLTIPENSPVPDNISEFPLTFILAGEELELKSLEAFILICMHMGMIILK